MQTSPYDYQARLPIDHALSLIRLIRTGNPSVSAVLKHVADITGELSALTAQGPIFSLADCSLPELTIDEAFLQLESLEFSAAAADPSFDPTPYIPILLLVLKWVREWLETRG